MAQEEITGTEISEFPEASTIYGGDVVAGVQSGSNKKFSFATIFSWIRNTLSAAGISYDPTTSGSTADNIQDALDEAFSDLEGKQSTITASGILKGDGAGGVSAATPGTDFATPSQIPTVPSASDSTPQDLGTATPGTSNDYSRADHVHTKPTPADIGAYVKPSGGIPSSDMASAVQTSLGKADTAYQKPSGGIPSSDMDSGVQTSLGKADTAYQKPSGGIPASDLASGVIPTVPSAYTSNPEMDGTASPGSSGAWAKGDHVHPNDTTKANQAQLATEETGSTASRAYDVGEYFCWNGLFYRVVQPISNGGTFTPGTNCVTDTVGERLGLIKTVLCATGTSANPANTTIPLKNSHTYLVTIQRVGDQYSSFGLIVQSNGTVWKNDLAFGGAYSNRYSVSTSTRTLTITAYLSAVVASIIDFGAYA